MILHQNPRHPRISLRPITLNIREAISEVAEPLVALRMPTSRESAHLGLLRGASIHEVGAVLIAVARMVHREAGIVVEGEGRRPMGPTPIRTDSL